MSVGACYQSPGIGVLPDSRFEQPFVRIFSRGEARMQNQEIRRVLLEVLLQVDWLLVVRLVMIAKPVHVREELVRTSENTDGTIGIQHGELGYHRSFRVSRNVHQ